jgi:hypothetical protein
MKQQMSDHFRVIVVRILPSVYCNLTRRYGAVSKGFERDFYFVLTILT